MAIEDAIKTQWGNDSTLNGLLASTSVSVGDNLGDKYSNSIDQQANPSDLLPRARLVVESTGFTGSDKSQYELHTITVQTYCTSNSSANTIRAALHDAFRNKNWTANGHKIILARVTGTDKEQLDDGTWQLETTIETESVEV